MKKTAYLLVFAVLLCGAPAFAQGPFTDVPTDHWAYDAVNMLQRDGVLIGYPDGTFGGRRTITRYEFAVALARVVRLIPDGPGPVGPTGITRAELDTILRDYVRRAELPQIPDLTGLATRADVEAIRRLVDEFRDELAALGVDVDALKRDVAALGARVDALEAEQRRVRIFGDATVFGIAGATTGGFSNAIDLDQRNLGQTLGRNITGVKDMDLRVVGRISEGASAQATINYGNYLNYLGFVDDYVAGFRPTSKAGTAAVNGTTVKNSLSDVFFPYYLYVNAGMGIGDLTVGRFPLQFTPYTLKMIDVDSYTNILKTSDGNYPVDGAKLAFNLGGIDLTLYAAKHNENDFLVNGLTSQPRGGLYNLQSPVFPALGTSPFHQLTPGHALGGLNLITQSAGVRGVVGTPFQGTLGATFYQGWDQTQFAAAAAYDQARVYGVDLALPVPFLRALNFTGSWTQSDTLGRGAQDDIDYLNTAWDGKINVGFGSLGIGAGYKDIGRNFAAAGYWDKIGRWTNPTNVKGPYADITYPFGRNLRVVLNGEFLEAKDDVIAAGVPILLQDDEIVKAEGAVSWGIGAANSLDVSYQWVRFRPTDAPGLVNSATTESYLTIGLGHQISPNAGIKVGYQFIGYNGDFGTRPYYNDYRGQLGVVQFGASF